MTADRTTAQRLLRVLAFVAMILFAIVVAPILFAKLLADGKAAR